MLLYRVFKYDNLASLGIIHSMLIVKNTIRVLTYNMLLFNDTNTITQ